MSEESSMASSEDPFKNVTTESEIESEIDSDVEEDELDPLVGRKQYLVTYSKANLQKFPTRESFGAAVQEEFDAGTSAAKVDYWACCLEPHKKSSGYHYHCSIKLTGSKKWVSVKRRLTEKHGIVVHFSAKHDFYLSSYRYVCKEDTNVHHSEEHPAGLLTADSPRTKSATYASKAASSLRRATAKNGTPTAKRRKLCDFEVAKLITAEKIEDYDSLLALADTRMEAGQNDLASYVFSKPESFLKSLIKKNWDMKAAKDKLAKSKLSRMDMIHTYAEKPTCPEPCSGQWLQMAKDVLERNNISLAEFSSAVLNLLKKGRGKHRNVLLIGPYDCAKTFLLKPLQVIFKGEIFENPSKDKYGWIKADKARVIFLNDFRFKKEQIAWNDLFLLLEGEPVKLPAPKNLYSEDICINTDVPIFATSKSEIKYKGYFGIGDEKEDDMMRARWKIFKFTRSIPEEEQIKLPPCAKCFTDLIYSK